MVFLAQQRPQVVLHCDSDQPDQAANQENGDLKIIQNQIATQYQILSQNVIPIIFIEQVNLASFSICIT